MSTVRRRAVLVLSALTLSTTRGVAQRHFPADSTVQAILHQQVTAKHTAGIVVGLLDADGSRRVLSAGKADNGALALDGNTVFEIGSITKTFTASLLADMVARGEVRLDQTVQSLLPSTVKIPSRNGREIRLVDLADVSSGLPSLPTNFKPADPNNPYKDFTVQQMYEFLSGYVLTRDIGSKYEYSNLGMGLLGHALALRGKKSYFDLLNERILQLLGMTDTRIDFTDDMRRRLALGHNPAGTIVSNWDIPTLAGAGALRSTVNDLFKYVAANLDSTGKPLGKILATTRVSRTETGNPNLTVGLAWHILKTPGARIVWHNGGTGGYRTFLGFDETKRVGVIVLTNSAISADDIGFHLIDPAFPISEPPKERKEVAIDPSVLPVYAGVYQLSPEFKVTVTVVDGALWVEPTGGKKQKALAESETDFFFPSGDIAFSFVKDASGAVTEMVVHQGGGTMVAKRVP